MKIIMVLQERMQGQWPQFVYNYQLIYQHMKTRHQQLVAEDPHGLNAFMNHGIALRANHGLFDFSVDRFNRLANVVRQSAVNKAYMEQYDDYIAMDGTHMVDQYGHILLMCSVVDCLGKAQCAGMVLSASGENAELCIDAMKQFGVTRGEGKTFHTDGGSWGPVVAEAFDRQHLLCTDHFSTKVLYACDTNLISMQH